MIDEHFRSRLHAALDAERPPSYLRSRVMSSLPERGGRGRFTARSLEWVRPWVAVLIALALIGAFIYVGQSLRPQLVHKTPHTQVIPAFMAAPDGIAIGPDGSLYFSDNYSAYVFKRLPDGTIATVAGTRPGATIADGDNGAGGPAIRSYLYGPSGIAFDRQGNLYVADTFAHRIRRIDRHGIITTYAGSGLAEPGMGGFGGDGGPATRAQLNLPIGIAFDEQGNLFVADTYNQRIRRIDRNGTITSLSNAGLPVPLDDFHPDQVAFDHAGNLYTVSSDFALGPFGQFTGRGCELLRRTPGGAWSLVAGTGTCGFGGDGGPATAAAIHSHGGMAFDAGGNLYFADSRNQRIRRIDPHGVITTVAAGLEYTQSLVFAGGGIYFTEQSDESPAPQSTGRVSALNLSDGNVTVLVTSTTPIRTLG